MMSQAKVATAMAARYLGQVCKHFGHKRPVDYAMERPDYGRVEFEFGVCTLSAADGVLNLRAEAGDESALTRLESVIALHLERFAFRDKPEIAWMRA